MTAALQPDPGLLERDTELGCLESALHRAAGGTGSVVLVSGEAGIGKTSLVRAFVRAHDHVRVLFGACDDLVTPRTLGPLRDAMRNRGGRLATALLGGDRDAVLAALLVELEDGSRPTVLVLEDVHWADDATLDVLRYIGRRVVDLPVVVVATYRDDEVGPSLQRVLGALGGPAVHRLAPARLSRTAVARLAGGTAATSAPLFRLSAGNPFYVTELVAATGSGEAVPATVVDAVLARVGRLGAAEQAALEQLSVVPSGLELPLARAVLGNLGALEGAERIGLVEMRAGVVAFRHELSRHAVEAAMPVAVRMHANGRVLAALLAGPDPDLARVVHHAAAAGDEAAVVAHAPAAARAAGRLGAHAQEAALQEQALRHADLLDPSEEAALWRERTATLFSLDRMPEALDAGRRAVVRGRAPRRARAARRGTDRAGAGVLGAGPARGVPRRSRTGGPGARARGRQPPARLRPGLSRRSAGQHRPRRGVAAVRCGGPRHGPPAGRAAPRGARRDRPRDCPAQAGRPRRRRRPGRAAPPVRPHCPSMCSP